MPPPSLSLVGCLFGDSEGVALPRSAEQGGSLEYLVVGQIYRLVGRLLPSVTVQSDASGGWGCGAVWGKLWLQVQWPSSWADVSIALKELAPIVFAALVFGRDLRNHHV